MLADRAAHYWDLPPLLIHLGEIAVAQEQFELAEHLFRRVVYLAKRGVPRLKMAAFTYVAEAALIDAACQPGDAADALARHRRLKANPGNAMAQCSARGC